MASTLTSILSILFPFFLSLPLQLFCSQLVTALVLALTYSAYAFIKSTITNNHSQVDEIWSIAPMLFTYHLNQWTSRGVVMLILSAVWGLRLSYNFWRKGGYRGGEDYRWEHVRKGIPNKLVWHIFNFAFISVYQMLLLLLLALPVYFDPLTKFGLVDFVLVGAHLALVGVETLADQQQWEFQSWKVRKLGKGKSVSKGFLDTGLFRYSRHPNFFAEILTWFVFYSFTQSLNISIAGSILLLLLFMGSTHLTEKLSAEKYPNYKEYQKTTSALIPWFSGRCKNN